MDRASAWPLDPQVVERQRFARLDVGDRYDAGVCEVDDRLLDGKDRLRPASRLEQRFCTRDQIGQLTRFDGYRIVGTGPLTRNREVFLHDHGAQGNGAQAGVDANRVIAETDRDVELVSQLLDGAESNILVRSWVRRSAVQHDERAEKLLYRSD